MTRPARVLVWMLPFLLLVGLTVAALLEPLREAFLSNPVFNAIIVGVFLIGVIVNFQQVGALSMEAGWVNRQRGRRRRGRQLPPRMLASLDRLLQQHGDQQPVRLSTLSLRAVLDSVRLRLDEARDVSRYTIGLLIFLGLLGTFWGLLQTVSAVGHMIGELNTGGGENGLLFGTLLAGLNEPLAGMGTAFSSSLFGLAGSLILGFLDLQVGHAQNRFFNELEDWLTSLTQMSSMQLYAEGQLSEPAYIHALLEQTAETLDKLQRHVMRDEAQRHNLDESIRRLADELSSERAQLSDDIRDEIRIIGRALSAEAHSRKRQRDRTGTG
jgi:hypothetical protein